MSEQCSHHPAAADNVAALQASLIQTVQHTAQVMEEIATARENAAANYRRMARKNGPDSDRHLQQAEHLDRSAARARQFAQQELEQIKKWQQPEDTHDSAS